jgi:hypothetical protein
MTSILETARLPRKQEEALTTAVPYKGNGPVDFTGIYKQYQKRYIEKGMTPAEQTNSCGLGM